MLRTDHQTLPFWLTFMVAFATIAGAWLFEWWGYDPCHLCLLERWPYYAAIILAPLFALIASNGSSRRLALLALGLLFVGSMVFGIYHSGIEWKWWPGPSSCTGSGQLTGLPDLTKKVVMCDEAALRILGLSLAGWNAVISAALAAILLRAAGKTLRFEFGVPIEIVSPALMQIVGREHAAIAVQLVDRRAIRFLRREHAHFAWKKTTLGEIAR